MDKFPYLRAKKAVTERETNHYEAKDIVPHPALRKSNPHEIHDEQPRGEERQHGRNTFLIQHKKFCDEERITLVHARKMDG